jgi:hypothetical protein
MSAQFNCIFSRHNFLIDRLPTKLVLQNQKKHKVYGNMVEIISWVLGSVFCFHKKLLKIN